jgi:hypothetical protein
VPLDFSPICSEELAWEVSSVLSVLVSTGAKMLTLEEVVSWQLEAEGCVLVERVVEHVLTYFQSWDPVISLDLVVLGLIAETEEAARCSVQDAAKIVAEWFERLPEDA